MTKTYKSFAELAADILVVSKPLAKREGARIPKGAGRGSASGRVSSRSRVSFRRAA